MDWYGIKGIRFIWHGEWADPEIEYNGKRLNVHCIEDEWWETYREETGSEDYDAFGDYMRDREDEIKMDIDAWIPGVGIVY